jgi:fructokinase
MLSINTPRTTYLIMSVDTSEDVNTTAALPAVVVLGEILWDLFADSRRLGGAPLNFAAHARSLGHPVTLISALGADAPGREAATRIGLLDLDTSLLKTSTQFATGTAAVGSGPDGDPVFCIERPAAYDALELSAQELGQIAGKGARWVYFGTLLASRAPGRQTLEALLDSLPDARRFLDLNLRPGSDSPELAAALLAHADVVKLNEYELAQIHEFTGLPPDIRDFCRAGSERFGWQAVCITLGERGCAMRVGADFIEAPGVAVVVADTVGAGDAFAAAFMHGLSRDWPAERIAAFANHLGASVAAQPGSLPAAVG